MSDVRGILVALSALILIGTPLQAREIDVLIESRKGIGLIPSFWRGVVTRDGILPDFGVHWARIDPALVARAWREKIGGGGPGWIALDAAIDSAGARGARVLVPIPVASAPRNEDRWSARVKDTVSRTHARVDRYEILADTTVSRGRYLDLYESAVWAAYQGYHRAVVGGPGVDLAGGLLGHLVERCRSRDLPLQFVSWSVEPKTGEEAESTFRAIERLLDREGLDDRPSALLSRWTMGDVGDPAGVTLSFLHGMTQVDYDAAFADLDRLPWGQRAMEVYDRLGQVEIPIVFDPPQDLYGVATLDGDDLRVLLWAKRPTRANISVSGMRWGRNYDYELSTVGVKRTQVVASRELRAVDPVEIRVDVSPGRPVFVTLTPKN